MMRCRYRLFLYLVLMSFSLTAYARDQQLPRLTGDAVILTYGDSLTYGTGTTQEKSYPAILQELSGRHVVSVATPGEVTAQGLARLPEALDDYSPQLLVLCLGGNDLLHRMNPSVTEHNLEKMVRISREHGVPVLLIGVPLPAFTTLKTAPFYYDLAKRLQIPLEADILPEVLSDRALKSDQIHPNAEGYRLIAEAVYNKLKKSGAL